jgi:hypothetical protein
MLATYLLSVGAGQLPHRGSGQLNSGGPQRKCSQRSRETQGSGLLQ